MFFAILMQKLAPRAEISVIERFDSRSQSGWGIFVAVDTLANIERFDPPTGARLRQRVLAWNSWTTHSNDDSHHVPFAGTAAARNTILEVLRERCEELGIRLTFQQRVSALRGPHPQEAARSTEQVAARLPG